MKRKIVFALLAIVMFSVISYPVFSAQCGGVDTSLIDCKSTGAGAIRSVALIALDAISIGAGILATIGIAVAGIQYLTAGGNEAQTTKAKRRIFEISIGIVAYVVMWTGVQWLLPGGLFARRYEVANVTLNGNKNDFSVGETRNFSPVLDPIDADNESFTWSSSDSSVATVDDNGKIIAKGEGSATISVTTSNGTTSAVTINVKKPADKKPEPSPSQTDTSDRFKLGSALAVLHSNGTVAGASDPDINTAINQKFYAVECDYQYNQYTGGTIKCYHTNSGGARDLADIAKSAKQNGVKVIVDRFDGGLNNGGLQILASIIKDNGLQDYFIGQTQSSNSLQAMDTLNSLVGKKLEYWGCVQTSMLGTYNSFINNASEFKNRGMTTINMQAYVNGGGFSVYSSNEYANKTKTAGFDVAYFSWNHFKINDGVNKLTGLGAKYLMYDDLQ